MKQRILGRVSDENPEEGLKQLLAHISGKPIEEIELDPETLEQLRQAATEKLEIKSLIDPFYQRFKEEDTKDSRKKQVELVDLGKLILLLGQKPITTIIECGERPDFVIEQSERLIGVEHTGLFDEQVVADLNSFKKVLQDVKRVLGDDKSVRGIYNLLVDQNIVPSFRKLDRKAVASELCELIKQTALGNRPNMPSYLIDIIRLDADYLDLTLAESYWLKSLTIEQGDAIIAKKEAKIDSYKADRNLSEVWLLIVMGGASSLNSFKLIREVLPVRDVLFDKIFVFDSFKRQIFFREKSGQSST